MCKLIGIDEAYWYISNMIVKQYLKFVVILNCDCKVFLVCFNFFFGVYYFYCPTSSPKSDAGCFSVLSYDANVFFRVVFV